jgi:Na+/proline symporter
MQFLLHLPVLISVLIISAVSIVISVVGLKIVRRRFSHETLKENHEVAGFIYNAFMLIYAVLVAFVVFVSWTDYSESKT